MEECVTGVWDIMGWLLSVVLYIGDVTSDVITMASYGYHGHHYWMGMTLLCIILPRCVAFTVYAIGGLLDHTRRVGNKRIRPPTTAPPPRSNNNASPTQDDIHIGSQESNALYGVCAKTTQEGQIARDMTASEVAGPVGEDFTVSSVENNSAVTVIGFHNAPSSDFGVPDTQHAENISPLVSYAATENEADHVTRDHTHSPRTLEHLGFSLLILVPILHEGATVAVALAFIVEQMKRVGEIYRIPPYSTTSWINFVNHYGMMFEGPFEAAPQFVLQIYIMFCDDAVVFGGHDIVILTSIILSLASLALASGNIYKTDLAIKTALKLSTRESVFMFLWRFCMVGPRLLALALFNTTHTAVFICVLLLHTIIMIVVFYSEKKHLASSIGDALLCNLDYLRSFSNLPKDYMNTNILPHSLKNAIKHPLIIHYLLTFAENSMMIALWYNTSLISPPFKIFSISITFISPILGIFFIYRYYKCLRLSATQIIKCCRYQEEKRLTTLKARETSGKEFILDKETSV